MQCVIVLRCQQLFTSTVQIYTHSMYMHSSENISTPKNILQVSAFTCTVHSYGRCVDVSLTPALSAGAIITTQSFSTTTIKWKEAMSFLAFPLYRTVFMFWFTGNGGFEWTLTFYFHCRSSLSMLCHFCFCFFFAVCMLFHSSCERCMLHITVYTVHVYRSVLDLWMYVC